jgi:hypothetical protein
MRIGSGLKSVYPLAGFCSAMQQHFAAASVADYSTAADNIVSMTMKIATKDKRRRMSL